MSYLIDKNPHNKFKSICEHIKNRPTHAVLPKSIMGLGTRYRDGFGRMTRRGKEKENII